MPLKQISLETYEFRLKKLAFFNSNFGIEEQIVTMKQLKASFADIPVISQELNNQSSMLYQLMTDDIFQSKYNKEIKEKGKDVLKKMTKEIGKQMTQKKSQAQQSVSEEYEYYDEEDDDPDQSESLVFDITKIQGIKLSVPKLMILGILYTASSAKQRAERFYELIQGELELYIETRDEEFKDYFPLIGQVCYQTIVKLYSQRVAELNRNHEDYAERYPQLKGMTWRPIDKKLYDFHKQKEITQFI